MAISKAELLISRIMKAEGLSGETAETRKIALKKLQISQLQELSDKIPQGLSNSNIKNIGFKNFVELPSTGEEKVGNLWGGGFATNRSVDFNFGFEKSELLTTSAEHEAGEPKKLTKLETQQAREFVRGYLFDAATGAVEMQRKYRNDVGVVDMVWQGGKNIVNLADFSFEGKSVKTINELETYLAKEYNSAEKIKNSTGNGSFEFNFEKERGKEFDARKVQDFEKKSGAFMELEAHKQKYDQLSTGVKELKEVYAKEQSLKMNQKRGVNVPQSAYPKESFDSKFVKIIDEYCQGDETLKEQFISNISKGINSKDDLAKPQNFLAAVISLEQKTKEVYQKQLNGKSYEEHKEDYQNAYQETLGGENPKAMTQSWVETQKEGAGFVKMGLVIASTVMLGGSNVLAQGASKLTQSIGAQATGHIVKFGMTTTGVATGVGLDYANALTSKTGLTEAKNTEILSGATQMIPYAFFGAYVSGPLGDKIVNALKGGDAVVPNILNKAFSASTKTAGFTAEVSLDTLFELAITDGRLMDVIQGNASGEVEARVINEFMSMVAGGRAHGAAKQIMKNAGLEGYKAVEQTDPKTNKKTYILSAPDGGSFKAETPESLISGMMAKAIDTSRKPETPEILSTPTTPEISAKKAVTEEIEAPKVAVEAPKVEIEPAKVEEPEVKAVKAEIKPLTAEEFKAKKADIIKQMQSFEAFKNVQPASINGNSVFVIETIIKNPKLLENQGLVDNLGSIVSKSGTAENAKAKIDFINKIIETPDLMNNKKFANYLGWIVLDLGSAKIEVMDKIIQTPGLMNNKNFVDKIADIIYHTNSAASTSVVFKIIETPDLMNNKNFADNMNSIIGNTSSAESAKAKIDVMDKIIQSPELMNNKSFTDNVGDIVALTSFEGYAKAKIDVINKIIQTPELMNNKNFADKVGSIIKNASSPANTSVAFKIIDTPDLMNNKNFVDNVGSIIGNTDSAISASVAFKIIDTPDLMHNKNFVDNVGSIIGNTDSAISASVAFKIIETPDLMNNKNFADKVGSIIKNASSPASTSVAFKIIENSDLMNNKNFADNVGSIMGHATSVESASVAFKIIENPSLMTSENFVEHLGPIIGASHSAESAKARIEVMDKIIAIPDLMDNKNFVENLGNIVDTSSSAESAKARIDVMDKIIETRDLMNNKNFAEKLGDIVGTSSSAENAKARIDVIDKIIATPDFKNKKDFADKVGDIIYGTTETNLKLVEKLFEFKNLDKSRISPLLGEANTKELVQKFGKMFDDPKLEDFITQQLNDGKTLTETDFLSYTQSKLYAENPIAPKQENLQQTAKTPDNIAKLSPEAENFNNRLSDKGVGTTPARFIQEACQEDGKINPQMSDVTFELLDAGVQAKEVGIILNAAKVDGEFRLDIVEDYLSLKDAGLNPMMRKNISAINHMTLDEIGANFAPKVKNNMLEQLSKMPQEQIAKMQEKGIYLEDIKAKLENKPDLVHQNTTSKNNKLRSRDKVVGAEKIILDKYIKDVPENIWRDPEKFKAWASEKVAKVSDYEANPQYHLDMSAGFAEPQNIVANRKKLIAEWYNHLKKESTLKDDPFAQLMVINEVTREMKPDNASVPPQVNPVKVEEVFNKLLEANGKASFSSLYSESTKSDAMKLARPTQTVDGHTGQWVTIPRTSANDAKYKDHVAYVQALSAGTNWCIRFSQADDYIQKGDINFFVDPQGRAQVCVREDNRNGRIAEIQKREQNATVPVAYANVIQDFVKEKKLNGCENDIKTAVGKKPAYDKLRNKMSKSSAKKDYKAIFEKMGIKVVTAQDGTMILSNYNGKVGDYTLAELNVNEVELLANVTVIKGDADFSNSSIEKFEKIQEVGRFLNTAGFNKIDVRSLQTLNGKPMVWDGNQ